MKKGLIGLAIVVILVITAVATAVGVMWFAQEMSSKITIDVGFDERLLMEDKLHFDSEKHFLENSLLVAGAYTAYKNGENGTVYKDSWGRCEGFDLDGNPYSYSCWKNTTDDNIPPESMTVDGIFNRTNETFEDYFSELEYTEIEDIGPLQMKYNRGEFNFSYKITEFNLMGDFLNHTMEEKNVWINTTIPIRYLMLRGNGSDFTQNSDARLNTKLISALDHVTVCTGLGQLTQGEAETEIEKELQNIAAFESSAYGGNFEWEMHLLEINDFDEVVTGPPHQYDIEFTINMTVRDADPGRRVTTTESLEKVGVTFAINDNISFTRTVTYICSGSSNCGSSGSASSCLGGICTYWEIDGTADSGALGDCSVGTDCYCEKTESCDCGNSPPDGCYNEDDYGPDIGCFECGSNSEDCCDTPACTNAGCRGSLRCRSGCTCVSTTTTTTTTTTTVCSCAGGFCTTARLCKIIYSPGWSCAGGPCCASKPCCCHSS